MEECHVGAVLCITNAIRLLADSQLLLHSKSSLSSACLATFAMEELGKGGKLAKAYRNKRNMSIQEWSPLSSGGGAHKLKIGLGWKAAMKTILDNHPEWVRGDQGDFRLSPHYEETIRLMAKSFQFAKEMFLYVNRREDQWMDPLQIPLNQQATFATAMLSQSFETAESLADEIGVDSSEIRRLHEEFAEEWGAEMERAIALSRRTGKK